MRAMRTLRLLLSTLLLVPAVALAQGWPGSRPVTILMGFPAGSGVDVLARLLQEPMEKSLGTNLVMDYRTGAGGNLASQAVATAKPDGYTLLLGTAATHGVAPALYKKLPFDVEADFTPIAPLADTSNVLTVNPNVVDAKSVKEFIDIVKKNPGKYAYASTGNGTGTHLAFAEFALRAGLDMIHVPYKGGPEAGTSVISGTTCCTMYQVQTVLPHWKSSEFSSVSNVPPGSIPRNRTETWFPSSAAASTSSATTRLLASSVVAVGSSVGSCVGSSVASSVGSGVDSSVGSVVGSVVSQASPIPSASVSA